MTDQGMNDLISALQNVRRMIGHDDARGLSPNANLDLAEVIDRLKQEDSRELKMAKLRYEGYVVQIAAASQANSKNLLMPSRTWVEQSLFGLGIKKPGEAT